MEALSDDERSFLGEWLWLAEKFPEQNCFGRWSSVCRRVAETHALCNLCWRLYSYGMPAGGAGLLQMHTALVKEALGLTANK